MLCIARGASSSSLVSFDLSLIKGIFLPYFGCYTFSGWMPISGRDYIAMYLPNQQASSPYLARLVLRARQGFVSRFFWSIHRPVRCGSLNGTWASFLFSSCLCQQFSSLENVVSLFSLATRPRVAMRLFVFAPSAMALNNHPAFYALLWRLFAIGRDGRLDDQDYFC
jgi:hypothetical protein